MILSVFHSDAPGSVVSADHPLAVEKGEGSLFHAASDDLGCSPWIFRVHAIVSLFYE